MNKTYKIVFMDGQYTVTKDIEQALKYMSYSKTYQIYEDEILAFQSNK